MADENADLAVMEEPQDNLRRAQKCADKGLLDSAETFALVSIAESLKCLAELQELQDDRRHTE